KDKNYSVRCRKKVSHILNDYFSVTVVILSKQSTIIFNLWSSLRKKTENDSNLFPPANIELDEEVNEYLDNIFSIFKSKETLNAENIFEEVELKQKL
ncbi:16_t:CDS:2, partial [Dentiscutata erythropus]